MLVADPGFPIEGRQPHVGAFWQKHAKTKELGPFGGHRPAAAPGSANVGGVDG